MDARLAFTPIGGKKFLVPNVQPDPKAKGHSLIASCGHEQTVSVANGYHGYKWEQFQPETVRSCCPPSFLTGTTAYWNDKIHSFQGAQIKRYYDDCFRAELGETTSCTSHFNMKLME